ncbi:hypothetical protein ACTXT7_016476 [Hymenolepis weldensis]
MFTLKLDREPTGELKSPFMKVSASSPQLTEKSITNRNTFLSYPEFVKNTMTMYTNNRIDQHSASANPTLSNTTLGPPFDLIPMNSNSMPNLTDETAVGVLHQMLLSHQQRLQSRLSQLQVERLSILLQLNVINDLLHPEQYHQVQEPLQPEPHGSGSLDESNGSAERRRPRQPRRQRVVAEPRTYDCNQCEAASFSSRGHLDRHTLEEHTGYRCNLCNANFTRHSHLLRHSVIHLETKPFMCLICQEGFNRKEHCKTHIIKRHPGASPKENIKTRYSPSRSLHLLRTHQAGNGTSTSNLANGSSVGNPASSHEDNSHMNVEEMTRILKASGIKFHELLAWFPAFIVAKFRPQRRNQASFCKIEAEISPDVATISTTTASLNSFDNPTQSQVVSLTPRGLPTVTLYFRTHTSSTEIKSPKSPGQCNHIRAKAMSVCHPKRLAFVDYRNRQLEEVVLAKPVFLANGAVSKVMLIKSATTGTVINSLHQLLANQGAPKVIESGIVTQFSSTQFEVSVLA